MGSASPPSLSPLLLLLVHGDAAGPQGHDQQQAADHRGGLEEVVLEEVVHGFVGRDGPEGVEGEVDAEQPGHQRQSGQLGLEAHRHQHNEGGANQVLQHLHANTQRLSFLWFTVSIEIPKCVCATVCVSL